SVDSVSSRASARRSRFIRGDLAKRTARVMQDELEEPEMLALLRLCLTPCQWSILRSLLAHPLLSDRDLARLLSLQLKSVRCAFYTLHRLGCLELTLTKIGKRWHLSERGLHLIAAASHLHIRTIAAEAEDET